MNAINSGEDIMNNPYADIIDLPHHVSKRHPQMPMEKRAAQFSPFAAVSGHDEAIHETARFTDEQLKLSSIQRISIYPRVGKTSV